MFSNTWHQKYRSTKKPTLIRPISEYSGKSLWGPATYTFCPTPPKISSPPYSQTFVYYPGNHDTCALPVHYRTLERKWSTVPVSNYWVADWLCGLYLFRYSFSVHTSWQYRNAPGPSHRSHRYPVNRVRVSSWLCHLQTAVLIEVVSSNVRRFRLIMWKLKRKSRVIEFAFLFF